VAVVTPVVSLRLRSAVRGPDAEAQLTVLIHAVQ